LTLDLDRQRASRDLHPFDLLFIQTGTTENGNSGEPRNNLAEQLQLFPSQFGQIKKYSRNIPARLCESSDESRGNRVALQIYCDDRDRARRPLGGIHCGGTARPDSVNLQPDKVAHEIGQPGAFGISIFNGEVSSVCVTELVEPLPEGLVSRWRNGSRSKYTDPIDSRRLLSLDGERHKSKADSENEREPDQPHEHLGGGWLAGV